MESMDFAQMQSSSSSTRTSAGEENVNRLLFRWAFDFDSEALSPKEIGKIEVDRAEGIQRRVAPRRRS